MTDLAALLSDLQDENNHLDEVVRQLSDAELAAATPAVGWSIRDQISHLAFVDERAMVALSDAAAFAELAAVDRADVQAFERLQLARGRSMDAPQLVTWWRQSRRALLETLYLVPPDVRIPWYGPSMSAASFATARLMEAWAHGCDIADTVGVPIPETDRLRHLVHLGFRTRGWSYAVRGLEPPSEPVAGTLLIGRKAWNHGDPAAVSTITGPALDFCLVVTQRRHWLDTSLEVVGAAARGWMGIAQAYAGAPGPGRAIASAVKSE